MTEDPNHAAWLEEARSHLGNADPVLARLIDDRPDFDPRAWLAQLPPMDLSRETWTSPGKPGRWPQVSIRNLRRTQITQDG